MPIPASKFSLLFGFASSLAAITHGPGGWGTANHHKALALPFYLEGQALEQEPGWEWTAEAKYLEAARYSAIFAEPRHRLAVLWMRQGSHSNAEIIAQLEEAARLEPKSGEMRADLAVALAREPSRNTEASAQFETALRLEPKLVKAWEGLGDLRVTTPSEAEGAIEAYRVALALDSGRTDIRYKRAAALAERPGKSVEAEAEYRRAFASDARRLQIAEVSPRPSVEAGLKARAEGTVDPASVTSRSPDTPFVFLLGRRDPARALDAANRMIREKPEADALVARAVIFSQQERWNEALADLRQAATQAPASFQPPLEAGIILLRQREWSAAATEFTRAIDRAPGEALAHGGRAVAFAALGQLEPALRDADHAVDLHSSAGTYWNIRAGILARLARETESLYDYTRAVARDPKEAKFWTDRSRLLGQRGNFAGALRDLDQAVRLQPADWRIYFQRGRLNEAKGDVAAALADYTQGMTRDPGNVANVRARGVLKQIHGDLLGALRDYERAEQIPGANLSQLRLWNAVLRLRLNSPVDEKALSELGRKPFDEWIKSLADFLAGRIDEPTLLVMAQDGDRRVERERRMEANYYAGILRRLRGDEAGARACFERSAGEELWDNTESRFALAALGRVAPNDFSDAAGAERPLPKISLPQPHLLQRGAAATQ